MQRLAILSLMLLGVIGTGTQYEKKMPKKVPGASRPKPECAQGSVCLSGEVAAGQTFRKDLNADLAFVITLPGNFEVVLKNADQSCKNHFSMANPPFRAHRQNEIDAEYDWTAEQEVETSPREFRFATNCAAYQSLYDFYYDDEKFVANLNSLANGKGRLWITNSKVTHSHGDDHGAVEWIKFSVEIKVPKQN